MKPLPSTRYEYAEWLKAKVNIDYHIEAERHYYSVPHPLVGEHVMVTDDRLQHRVLLQGRPCCGARAQLCEGQAHDPA